MLIVATLTGTVAESVPELAIAYAVPFSAIEWAATLAFSLEYAARLWSSAEHPLLKQHGALYGPLRFAFSFPGLIDLAAILPFWLSVFIASDFRVLLVLRLVRFFKLTRYSPAMRSLLDALYAERRALTGCFVILLGTALIAAALMHLAERTAQPDRFGTIPEALWWGDRDARDDWLWLWRCRSGHCAGSRTGGLHDLRRVAHDGIAGRHFRHRLSSNFSEGTLSLTRLRSSLKPRF